jgi:beta-galactosidase/beta-glucuronidase
MSVPRPEYPRPQFVREAWLNLNGPWDFSFDEPGFDRTITVPFAYQAALSGIGTDERHDRVWYRRAFALPEDWAGKRVLLHFGAVDYTCKVWVNGALAGGHTGGHAGFSLDVTEALRPGENVLTVLAEDDHADREMPRGKQYWGEKPRSIFYTPTSGIWQTVWLEPVSEDRLLSVRVTPDLAGRQVFFDYELSRPGLVLTAAAACPDGAAVSARSDGEAGAGWSSPWTGMGWTAAPLRTNTPGARSTRRFFGPSTRSGLRRR